MRTITLSLLPLALLLACGESSDDTGSTDGTNQTVESFPAGSSAWTGTVTIDGNDWSFGLDLEHSEGRLEGTATFEPDGAALALYVAGVVDRETGAVVLVPKTWVEGSPGIEVVGLTGTYDPASDSFEGTVRDVNSWDNNIPSGGPFSLNTTAEPAEVELSSIPAPGLPEETTFSGTFKCLGDTRPVSGSLSRGASGLMTGEARWEEASGAYIGSFEIEALESEGWLSIQPLTWTEEDENPTNYANAYVDGSLSGLELVGTLSQNIGADCEDGAVLLTFQ